MASFEPSTLRLPEEDYSDMDSNSDNEVLFPEAPSLQKSDCVCIIDSTKTFPWATTSRKGSSFAFCIKCSHDINLGRGGTRDLRRHQETKLHKHSEKVVWVYCLYSHTLGQ